MKIFLVGITGIVNSNRITIAIKNAIERLVN